MNILKFLQIFNTYYIIIYKYMRQKSIEIFKILKKVTNFNN